MGDVTNTFSLAVAKGGAILATDFKPRTISGLMNHYSGYGEYRIEQTPLESSGSYYTIHKQVAFTKDEEGSLLVNQDIKNAVSQNRVAFSPIDPGNNHDMYERAFYQNRRVANLFTSGLDLIVPLATNVRLLDTVSVSVDSKREYLRIHSGSYRVVSKTICIVGINYYEKFELARRTLNATLANAQTDPSVGNLSEEVAP
jgi:hypothetical protein